MGRYKDRIDARFARQEAKGISKYGQTLEQNPRPAIEALEYMLEEMADMMMYGEELLEKLKKTDCRTCRFYDLSKYWCTKHEDTKLQQETCEDGIRRYDID